MRPFWLTSVFWGMAVGLFLSAYVYGVSAVALSWVPHQGRAIPTLLLIWSPLVLALGIAAGGILADRFGRRRLLAGAPFGYIAGSVVLSAGSGLVWVLIGTFFLLATSGIEGNTLLAYSQELPATHRRQTAMAELASANLGAISLAALALGTPQLGLAAMRDIIAVLPLSLALFSLALRRNLPESSLWELSRSRPDRTIPSDYGLRFFVSASFSTATTTGFSLLAFAFGAEFLPRHFHHMLLVSTAAALLVGLTYRRLSRAPSELTLVGAYGLATASAVLLYLVRRPGHPAFWPVLFLQSAFAAVSYCAEDLFGVNRWPAFVRGRTVGGVRAAGLIIYAGIVLWAHSVRLGAFLSSMIATWSLGLAAALVWWVAHSNTARKIWRRANLD